MKLSISVIPPKVYLPSIKAGRKEIVRAASVARTSKMKRVAYLYDNEFVGAPSSDDGTIEHSELYPTSKRAFDLVERILNLDPPHESPLYHTLLRIDILCSRIISHQLVRHKHTEFMQSSTRYILPVKGKSVTVIKPMSMNDNDIGSYVFDTYGINRFPLWVESAARSSVDYVRLISDGVDSEDARYILPHCIPALVTCSANLFQWVTMCKKRCQKKASPEIQYIFNQIKDYLEAVNPVLVKDI